jgi:hypothetical protein
LATSKRRNSIFLYTVVKDLNPPSNEFSERGSARPVPGKRILPDNEKSSKNVCNQFLIPKDNKGDAEDPKG